MGARDAHLEQARSNKEHVVRLLALYAERTDPNLLRWVITGAFYTAVHCIEAELDAQGGQHSDSHRDRARLMKQIGIPDDVRRAYQMLKDFSEDARYRIGQFEIDWVRQVVIEKYLDRITRWSNV